MHKGNIFSESEAPIEGERFTELLHHKNLLIERIVSSAEITPAEYRQPQDEWVLLVQGEAVLDIAGNEVNLCAGDYVFLPAGVVHVVKTVSQGAVWLAVHLFPTD